MLSLVPRLCTSVSRIGKKYPIKENKTSLKMIRCIRIAFSETRAGLGLELLNYQRHTCRHSKDLHFPVIWKSPKKHLSIVGSSGASVLKLSDPGPGG